MSNSSKGSAAEKYVSPAVTKAFVWQYTDDAGATICLLILCSFSLTSLISLALILTFAIVSLSLISLFSLSFAHTLSPLFFTHSPTYPLTPHAGKFRNYDAKASDIVESSYEAHIANPHVTDVRSVHSGDWDYQV